LQLSAEGLNEIKMNLLSCPESAEEFDGPYWRCYDVFQVNSILIKRDGIIVDTEK
jgi:hypothetical protein